MTDDEARVRTVTNLELPPRRIVRVADSFFEHDRLVGAGCGNRTHDLMITRDF